MSDFRFHSLRLCKFRFTILPISDFPYPIVLGSMSELLFSDFRFISFKIRCQIVDTFKFRCSICWFSDFSNHYLFCISIVGFRFCFVSNFQFRFVGRCLISLFDFRNYFGLLPALPWSKVKTHRSKNGKGCLKQGGFKETFLSQKVALNKQALKQPFSVLSHTKG